MFRMTSAVLHITTRELADELRVDPSTVRRWVDTHRLTPALTTPGGHHRFVREDALAELAPKPTSPVDAPHVDGSGISSTPSEPVPSPMVGEASPSASPTLQGEA